MFIEELLAEFVFKTVFKQKESFQIQIQLRAAGDLNDAQIDCEWRLKELIEQDKAIIEQVNH